MKKQNGITLVALVITIIILLILATISLSALQGQGLFQRAQQAREATNEATNLESNRLTEYETAVNEYLPNKK